MKFLKFKRNEQNYLTFFLLNHPNITEPSKKKKKRFHISGGLKTDFLSDVKQWKPKEKLSEIFFIRRVNKTPLESSGGKVKSVKAFFFTVASAKDLWKAEAKDFIK